MKLFFQGIGQVFRWLFKVKVFTSYGVAGIWVITNFFVDLIRDGIGVAGRNLAYAVGGAELTIRDNVMLAVSSPENYHFIHLLEIFASVMILLTVGKAVVWLLINFTGSQAKASAYIVAFVLVIPLITLASGRVFNEEWFIPVYDSLIFLFKNLDSVLLVFLPSFLTSSSVVNETVNDTINESFEFVTNTTNITNIV